MSLVVLRSGDRINADNRRYVPFESKTPLLRRHRTSHASSPRMAGPVSAKKMNLGLERLVEHSGDFRR